MRGEDSNRQGNEVLHIQISNSKRDMSSRNDQMPSDRRQPSKTSGSARPDDEEMMEDLGSSPEIGKTCFSFEGSLLGLSSIEGLWIGVLVHNRLRGRHVDWCASALPLAWEGLWTGVLVHNRLRGKACGLVC